MAKLQINLGPINELKERLSDALVQTTEDLFDISQQLVPVDTGLLNASGETDITEFENGRPTKTVFGYGGEGSQREQVAIWMEYGNSRVAAQPYMEPAAAQAEQTFKVRLEQAARK